jgi:hypothetical protein
LNRESTRAQREHRVRFESTRRASDATSCDGAHNGAVPDRELARALYFDELPAVAPRRGLEMTLTFPRAFVVAVAVCTAADAQSAPAMVASIVEGTATVRPAGGPSEQPLAKGAALQSGDVIRTGAEARVQISMSSGSTLRLGPNATLELREADPVHFSARLSLGSLWAKVHKLLTGDSFEVETENAVAAVRGTEFLVDAGGEDRLRVYEGTVEARGASGQWTERVEKGNELHFRRGGEHDRPRAFDASSDRAHPLMKWVREDPVRPEAERERTRSPKEERGERERRERRRLR